ncbi:MAG: isochorismatase family protein [Bacteroidales bacterium]|jgi:nicotinamidase-related amidase|nr:isochorismatase family protein [Bacteroidales bacterium]
MKRIFSLLITLVLITSAVSFSQDVKQQTGIKPALLVIDIQNAFLEMIPENDREMGMLYINGLIELFRSNGYPVIRVYHHSKEYGVEEGTERFEFPSTVLIKPEDPKVLKTYPDGFNKTDLDKVIKETGSNTLFLCGLSAVGCVLATWIGAQNHDYKAFLVKEAIMSHNSEYTDNIEVMFDAVSYEVVKLIIESSKN